MTDEIIVTVPAAEQDETFGLPHFQTYNNQRERVARTGDEDTLWNSSLLSAARLLQVKCPHCHAEARSWCRLPNGRLYTILHLARWKKAYAEGWWDQVTIQVPDVSGEPATKVFVVPVKSVELNPNVTFTATSMRVELL